MSEYGELPGLCECGAELPGYLLEASVCARKASDCHFYSVHYAAKEADAGHNPDNIDILPRIFHDELCAWNRICRDIRGNGECNATWDFLSGNFPIVIPGKTGRWIPERCGNRKRSGYLSVHAPVLPDRLCVGMPHGDSPHPVGDSAESDIGIGRSI